MVDVAGGADDAHRPTAPAALRSTASCSGSTVRRSSSTRSSLDTGDHGRVGRDAGARPARSGASGPSSATAQLGCVWPGSEPPPMAETPSRLPSTCPRPERRVDGTRTRRDLGWTRPRSCARPAPALGLAAQIVHQRRAERGQRGLVRPDRAHQRVAFELRDQPLRGPTMMPACGPPSSLSPEKHDQRRRQRPRCPGPSARAPDRSALCRAASPTRDRRPAAGPCSRRAQPARPGCGSCTKPITAKVRAVNAQQQRRLLGPPASA